MGKNYEKENNLRKKLKNKLGRITNSSISDTDSIEDLVEALIQFYDYLLYHTPSNVYWLDKNCITLGYNKNVLNFIGISY